MSKLPYLLYKISRYFYKLRVPLIHTIIMVINRVVLGAYIPATCEIGNGTRFSYGGSSVVIHARAVIGKNCTIGPCVTIGGRSRKINVPIIGDNVYIGGGSKVLGDVTIGNNVVIGANSVILESIPNNCIVVGIPGRIIKRGIEPKDYV